MISDDLVSTGSNWSERLARSRPGRPDAGVVKTFVMRILTTLQNTADSRLALLLGAYTKELMKNAGVPLE